MKGSHQTLIMYNSVHFLVGQCHSLKLIKLAFKITYTFVPISLTVKPNGTVYIPPTVRLRNIYRCVSQVSYNKLTFSLNSIKLLVFTMVGIKHVFIFVACNINKRKELHIFPSL